MNWKIDKQYQSHAKFILSIPRGWEPFAVTPTTDGVWIWLRKQIPFNKANSADSK